ncbi:MAG: hypothetical protein IJN88_00630 [Clostridia bacterium]|nr:hypothetical protein [Clostridia bacterium]
MKTDREMANDILCKVNSMKEERRMMKNRMGRVAALSCVFALIFVAVFSLFIGGTTTDEKFASATSENTPPKKAFLMVANAAYETETVINKDADVTLPMGGILIAKDTKGMTFSEKDTVMLELKERLIQLYGKDCDWHLRGIQEDTTVYFGTADYLKVKIENPDSVDKISISCTDSGIITVSDKSKLGGSLSEYIKTIKQGTSITVTGKEYTEIYEKTDGICIEWFLSEIITDAFMTSPDMPLSEVEDEITISINYTDGSAEDYTVSFSFNDEGMLSAKCSF